LVKTGLFPFAKIRDLYFRHPFKQRGNIQLKLHFEALNLARQHGKEEKDFQKD